eukprot:Rhum_TRINITY_DN16679_c0_g1::Rhum_TRINITY_DN16679_c0_g1_i1::g.164010::m.164010
MRLVFGRSVLTKSGRSTHPSAVADLPQLHRRLPARRDQPRVPLLRCVVPLPLQPRRSRLHQRRRRRDRRRNGRRRGGGGVAPEGHWQHDERGDAVAVVVHAAQLGARGLVPQLHQPVLGGRGHQAGTDGGHRSQRRRVRLQLPDTGPLVQPPLDQVRVVAARKERRHVVLQRHARHRPQVPRVRRRRHRARRHRSGRRCRRRPTAPRLPWRRRRRRRRRGGETGSQRRNLPPHRCGRPQPETQADRGRLKGGVENGGVRRRVDVDGPRRVPDAEKLPRSEERPGRRRPFLCGGGGSATDRTLSLPLPPRRDVRLLRLPRRLRKELGVRGEHDVPHQYATLVPRRDQLSAPHAGGRHDTFVARSEGAVDASPGEAVHPDRLVEAARHHEDVTAAAAAAAATATARTAAPAAAAAAPL